MTDLTGRMNKQEIFDTVAKHLIQQGKASVDEAGQCKYRYQGCKCAAGVLIPDDLYDPKMEGWTITSSQFAECLSKPLAWMDQSDFVEKLQRAHDDQLRNSGFDAWRERMREIAKLHELNTDALD